VLTLPRKQGQTTQRLPQPILTTNAAGLSHVLTVSARRTAARTVRVHCVVRHWPHDEWCLNWGWPHPCVTYWWGHKVLLAAGWSEREIAALDSRQGAPRAPARCADMVQPRPH